MMDVLSIILITVLGEQAHVAPILGVAGVMSPVQLAILGARLYAFLSPSAPVAPLDPPETTFDTA
jgi:hypothetical protein